MPVKIMLVGNQPRVANVIRETSEILQWCDLVTEAESHRAAALLQHEKFDGIILYADMPEPDGFDLTRIIRGSPLNSSVPIVMLTEDESISTMRKGFKVGVTFFMTKPSNRERVYSLFNAIRGALVRERRRNARLPYQTRVTCRWGSHQEKQFVAESIDIGEGGMSLRPSGGLAIGQELVLTFTIPEIPQPARASVAKAGRSMFQDGKSGEAEPNKLRAVVRYEKPPDAVGLEFLVLPQAYRQYIQHFLNGADED